jgi:hypothetical protein
VTLYVVVAGLVGCASSEGTAPHDQSAAAHEDEAAREDTIANAHAALYDPGAVRERPSCAAILTRKSGFGSDVCWGSLVNPTDVHRAQAEARRRIAAEHRAASQALREAEASACRGLGDDERDTSPFQRLEDIASVASLAALPEGRKHWLPGPRGAVVTFVAVPGMTAEWLQRLVDCHVARNAVLGHVDPTMPACPLVPRGVTAKVTSTGIGFAVAMRSDDPETAKEILRRARALVAPPSPPVVIVPDAR